MYTYMSIDCLTDGGGGQGEGEGLEGGLARGGSERTDKGTL